MYVVLFNRVLKEVEKLRVDSRVAKGKTEVFQMNVDGSVFSEYPGTKVRGGGRGGKEGEGGREREGERREREGGREKEEERGRERGGGRRGKEEGEGKRREGEKRKGRGEEQGDRGKRRRMTVMVLYCG